VVFQGRNVASPPANQPQHSEPQTIALPVNPTSFVFKSGTDVWEMTGTLDRNANMVIDLNERGGPPGMAGAMAMVCQWLIQNINGQPRTDVPLFYENAQFQSVAVTVIGHNPGTQANSAPSGSAATRQSPVSARIGLLGSQSPTQDVLTPNISALNASVGMPGTHNHVEFAFGGGLPNILFGKFQESQQENFFIEDLTGVLTPDAPVPAYFDASGRAAVNGGIFTNLLPVNVVPQYDANLNIFWYYWGAVVGHMMGNGLGLNQVAFSVPGASSNGEEDLMNLNLETDVSFYATAGRRFQYTSEGLLHMQNTIRFPLGSQARADGEAASQSDPFDPAGTKRGETAPGPNR
ncbi:MAG: hypothetical protein KDB07_03045, partial [Planctomycetes bacterium]|nr:hypothetical protein [Planctomycetota bacterium]